MNIVEPAAGSLIGEGFDRNFKIELENFTLTSEQVSEPNFGILKVFYEGNKEKPLLEVKKNTQLDNGKALVEFSSNQFDKDVVIPDNRETKLIFQLFKANGEVTETVLDRKFITNYAGSLKDLGLPEVNIIEPQRDRVDQSVDLDRKFILEVKNFTLLDQISSGFNEEKRGYLQVLVDDVAVQTIWAKTEFTLSELAYKEVKEGKKTVKVQLVNKDFTKLVPAASSSIDIIYKPKLNVELDSKLNAKPATNWLQFPVDWSLVLVLLVSVIFIARILYIVFKG
jgi:hypothetical protein